MGAETLITKQDVEKIVAKHAPTLVPGWSISCKIFQFPDWTENGRAEIGYPTYDKIGIIRVDPRTKRSHLEHVVVHELVHALLRDMSCTVHDILDRYIPEAEQDLASSIINIEEERLDWVITRLYLRKVYKL